MKSFSKVLPLFVLSGALLISNVACRADQALSLDGGILSGSNATKTADGLQVDFGNKDAWPNIEWRAPEGTTWDWSGANALVFTLANPGAQNTSFHVKVNDVSANGSKRSAQFSGSVPAGETGKFYVSLEPRSLREKSGMRVLPPIPNEGYGKLIGTGIEPKNVERLQIFRATPKETATLIIKSIALEGKSTNMNLDGIIDRYGQYTRADWPGKIKSDADLVANKQAEDADLKVHRAVADRSRWGGWTGAPRQKATGFFRTQEINGKWWLIDPEGYQFLSVGIDVVRPNLSTIIRGREHMFTWLPKPEDPLAKFLNGNDYDFLRANLTRKYGGDVDATFDTRAIERLRSWGFNTIGNWTPERLGKEKQFPYVAAVGTKGGFATVPGHKNHKMPDPFDPKFAEDVERQLLPKVAVSKNDPACIGYFFDNELPWGMPSVDNEHYVLAFGALSLGPDSPAKQAFLNMLKGRYNSIDDLNKTWKTKLASWDELAAPFKVSTTVQSPEQRKDFSDYLTVYAEKYFEIVAGTIKRLDPDHLYLGPRFAFWFTEEAVKASAKYVDVISFNIYSYNRNTYSFAQKLGKPCIVGEFHFGATDRGMFTGNVTVKDQQARGDSYSQYVKDLLSEPAFVGVHWFQFYDEPTTGRGSDGENFNIGFVSVTDTPYPELIEAARSTNHQIYKWHVDSTLKP